MTGCERIIKEGILSIFFESETICGFYVDEKKKRWSNIHFVLLYRVEHIFIDNYL